VSSPNPIYQTVGGGSYYLTNGSPYRNAGTTNIDTILLADLRTKTTYPPILYYTPQIYFSSNLNLFPQTQRDTNANTVDLGYHYDPLDYLIGAIQVTNATITFNPGTAIGFFGTASYYYGMLIGDNANFSSIGSPNNLIHIVGYNVVQEQNATNWITAIGGLIGPFSTTASEVNCRFTDWSVPAQDAAYIETYSDILPVDLRDCQFRGGQLVSWGLTINLTNCLLERVNCNIFQDDTNVPIVRNNLVYWGTFGFSPTVTNSVVRDNLFDHTAIPDYLGGAGITYVGGHNAFVTNCDTLDPVFPGDIILSNSIAYQTGPLGNYYQPTNSPLINAGSTTADQVGLYHYTVTTNEVVEGTNTVSIGYHYVALDQYGNPLDSNGDGIPDYLEDANGDGIYDFGDLGDWQNTLYLKVLITRPQNGSTMP